MVLSYSRMKFAYCSAEPFDAKKTIEGHVYAFRYFGGRPQMIVYDQDKTMVVSENLGDVIFVKEFEDFIRETGFSIYLCRGYDPSTKGKVEKTVDFVKHQFLDGRIAANTQVSMATRCLPTLTITSMTTLTMPPVLDGFLALSNLPSPIISPLIYSNT